KRHWALAFAIALLTTMVVPAATLATDPPPDPFLVVYDAPVTRTQTVFVQFVQPGFDPVDKYYLSNSPDLDVDGHLLDRTEFSSYATWVLAAGPAGPRTIYGQIKYVGGGWSNVVTKDLTLHTDAGSSMYM